MDIKTILTSATASLIVTAVTVPVMVNFVTLQPTTPGTAETGHSNITGTAISGKIRVGTSIAGGSLIRVEDTTGAGGLYSKSTGNGVYSESSGIAGSLIGGQFIARSTGGRGVIGSATSLTGATRGGIFDSKSSEGVGVYGLSSALTGTGVGVYGAATAATGTAVVASNPNAGTRVELAGANGAIFAKGNGIYNEYKTGQGNPAIPVAYGIIGSAGGIFNSGSSNWTVTSPSTGVYEIDILGVSWGESSYTVVASCNTAGAPRVVWRSAGGAGDIKLNVTDLAGAAATAGVHFVVFGNTFPGPQDGTAPPRANEPFNNSSIDFDKNPAARSWLKKKLKEHEEASRIKPSGHVSVSENRP